MKKTILGVILATFLVLSLSFIAPVHVKAVETNIKQTKQNIGNLAIKIANHEKYDELVEQSELVSIIEDVLENGATQQKASEYWNIIKDLDAFKEICSDDILNDAESIHNSINDFLAENNDPDEEKNGFYISIDGKNSLSVSEDYKTNAVFYASFVHIAII